jgi:glycogen debranching enzyme
LHDLVTVLWAPSVCLSARDGQIRGLGCEGFYSNDQRVLSLFEVSVAGAAAVPVGSAHGGSEAVFISQVHLPAEDAADAPLAVRRHRQVVPGRLAERIELVNFTPAPVRADLVVRCATDLAPVQLVRGGGSADRVIPECDDRGRGWIWGDQLVRMTVDPAPSRADIEDGCVVLRFDQELPPAQSASVTLQVVTENRKSRSGTGTFLPVADESSALLSGPSVAGAAPADPLRRRLWDTSLRDLRRMLLADPLSPWDRFLAAGSPWYLTLFGRDALWSASLLLPVTVEVAAGTLRALQRRQGQAVDPATEEEPGKILHEERGEKLRLGALTIPPLYYGTIDATLLWIRLLHDAWQYGMDRGEVEELLGGLQAALNWMVTYGDADGDGFIEYQASPRGGLANQGWKDLADSIRWADGRPARAPLALCEVQGYAFAAAMQGASLLEAFGVRGTDRWREWALTLQDRFRRSFWISDASGSYPAIALDAGKRPVDGAASNMAHLLGTGLLTSAEAALIAGRLSQPDLDCGYGLRTLSSSSAAFNPFSYHCGSVWPHDTAIAVLGLAAEGHHTPARSLAEGVVKAAEQFGFRLPELYAGTSARDGEPVAAYPASCRPQAWAAAGAVAIVGYLEGQSPLTALTIPQHPSVGRRAARDSTTALAADQPSGTPHAPRQPPQRSGS